MKKSFLLTLACSLPLGAQVDFNDHIQPILSEYCYHCHGPDSSARLPEDAPLRLDREDGAFAPRKNGKTVIIKGDAKNSLLYQLLTSTDKDKIMPPPESHKVLPPEKIKLLAQWINEGAVYEDHWSFISPQRAELPKLDEKMAAWAGKNPIDNYIAAELAAHQLAPNPAADPGRFYRRLHFDLTGLPPTPEEAAAFSMDKLDAEIDRLLATDAAAEHLARHWLDVARYADTHGIHIDNYRSIWPYRDWVIAAYKKNMPFDQFVTEQIAGDLLPNPTNDQLVATGFNRCMPTTGEGGAIAEEYFNIYALDQTTTTSTAFLGLTMGCSACHDHKFDPILQKDTYAFNAFFRNTTMSALDGNNANHPPNVMAVSQLNRAKTDEVTKKIADTQAALKAREAAAPADYQAWLATLKTEAATADLGAPEILLPLIYNEPKASSVGVTVKGEVKQVPAAFDTIPGKFNNSPLVSGAPVILGDLASFSRGEQISYGGFVRIEGAPTGAIIARMNKDEGYRGWDLYLQGGLIGGHIIDTFPAAANKIMSNAKLSEKDWHHVMITFDGTKPGPETTTLYVDGQKAAAGIVPNSVGANITTAVPLILGSRNANDAKLIGGTVALQNFAFYRRLLSPEEIKAISENKYLKDILAIAPAQRSKEDNEVIFRHYLANVDPTHRQLTEELGKLNSELEAVKTPGALTLIMQEKPGVQPFAHILIRGEYANKGDKVDANTPEFLLPLPEGAPKNRLGLAQWLIDKKNPLTARVTMNRLWYYFYGTGLVETTEDFGVMGARPSHPKLLDWLAVEFMESGWNYQHMIKLIASSKAYAQSEKTDSLKLEADPDNRLISRGPRYRLNAEEIRDMALASSDLLVKKIGGPSVKPYQPDGVWSSVAMKGSTTGVYKQDTGENLYRRSLYTIWKRIAAPPSMEILNAPTREITCVRRDLTNTPLQAFVTLNDPQFVETSRQLAENALKASTDKDERLDFITRRLLTRDLRPDERMIVLSNLEKNREIIATKPETSAQIISEGEKKADPAIDPLDLATWTITASQILNLDETLTK